MCMGAATDFMRQRNPAHWPFCKAFAVDQYAFGCSAIFVGHKTDEIAVILVNRTDTWGKGCLTAVAPLWKLHRP